MGLAGAAPLAAGVASLAATSAEVTGSSPIVTSSSSGSLAALAGAAALGLDFDGIVAVVMASALGYWISVKTAAPQRNKAAMTGSIKDLSSAPPRAVQAAASRAQADTVPAVAAVASQPQPAASRTESPPMTRNPARAAARQSAQSVFVPNPEWSSQVRRMGDVDPVTERSTMVILDAIHDVQERERQSRPAASKEVGREH